MTVLSLSAVSVGIFVYQHNQRVFHRNVHRYIDSRGSQSRQQHEQNPKRIPGRIIHTSPTTTPDSAHVVSDVAHKPAFTMSDNNRLVTVKVFASDVTASDLQNVKQLLSKYNIVDTDAKTLQMNLDKNVSIVLCKNQTDYQKELASIGVPAGDAQRFTLDSGGLTDGSTIVIPLYQNTSSSVLANTLGHELTHAILNQNVISFPSWMNEGLAVTDGLHIQSEVENVVAYQGYTKQMAEDVLKAAKSGSLWPLASNESKVLSGTAPYDLELQDWLAVRDLIQQHGLQAFSDYFYRLKIGESLSTAFQRSFGSSESAFNQYMTSHLSHAAETPDDGATLSFRVPAAFQGHIRILQHGTQTWVGFQPAAGVNTVTVTDSGALTGAAVPLVPVQDSAPPDETTLYVNVDPFIPFTYQGQKVQTAGFAVDYHYGIYSFLNAWITLDNGTVIYLNEPALFGIQFINISETQPNSWLMPLLSPPSGVTPS